MEVMMTVVMTMMVMMKIIVMTMMMIIISNRVSQEVGRTVYTLMLNQAGGIEADLTITRFFIISSYSNLLVHHYHHHCFRYRYHHPHRYHQNHLHHHDLKLGVDTSHLVAFVLI